jgi:hypothetical protein
MNVPGDRDILRLPKPPKDFVPEAYRPSSQEFQPSSLDVSDAAAHGHPVRVSVWDNTITSIDEAFAFRAGPALVLRAGTSAVLQAGASAVVYEPLPPPDSAKPGAAGHAGIEGLDRAAGVPKTAHKDKLAAVATCFRLVK